MRKVIGLLLCTVGIILLVLGIQSAHSIGDSFYRLVMGAPTDITIWLVLGGAAATAIGATQF